MISYIVVTVLCGFSMVKKNKNRSFNFDNKNFDQVARKKIAKFCKTKLELFFCLELNRAKSLVVGGQVNGAWK